MGRGNKSNNTQSESTREQGYPHSLDRMKNEACIGFLRDIHT